MYMNTPRGRRRTLFTGEENVKSESEIVPREQVPDDFNNFSGTVLHYLGRWVPYTTFCRHHGIHSTFMGLLELTRLHVECVFETFVDSDVERLVLELEVSDIHLEPCKVA